MFELNLVKRLTLSVTKNAQKCVMTMYFANEDSVDFLS